MFCLKTPEDIKAISTLEKPRESLRFLSCYTGFLPAMGIDIVNAGVVTSISLITSFFNLFSPTLLLAAVSTPANAFWIDPVMLSYGILTPQD